MRGAQQWARVRGSFTGRCALAPNRRRHQSLRGHGLENAAVFGGGARGSAGQWFKPGNSAVEILVAAVLQGFLDLRDSPSARLEDPLTIEGEDRTHRLCKVGTGS